MGLQELLLSAREIFRIEQPQSGLNHLLMSILGVHSDHLPIKIRKSKPRLPHAIVYFSQSLRCFLLNPVLPSCVIIPVPQNALNNTATNLQTINKPFRVCLTNIVENPFNLDIVMIVYKPMNPKFPTQNVMNATPSIRIMRRSSYSIRRYFILRSNGLEKNLLNLHT